MFAAFVGKARGGSGDSLQLRQRLPRHLPRVTLLTVDERQMTVILDRETGEGERR
jgi:hypothetical protein